MKFPHLNRRTHLYLGLFLTPWVLMYAISSFAFAHSTYFEERDKASGRPLWTQTFEGPYDLGPIPESGSLRPLAGRVARDFHLESQTYGAYRPNPRQVNVFVHTFWKATQFRYLIAEKRIIVEQRRFRWDHFLTGLHARGGFEDGRFFAVAWAVVIDLVCLSFVVWIASGLFMWWSLPSPRRWGWVAVGGGLVSFSIFLARL